MVILCTLLYVILLIGARILFAHDNQVNLEFRKLCVCV